MLSYTATTYYFQLKGKLVSLEISFFENNAFLEDALSISESFQPLGLKALLSI